MYGDSHKLKREMGLCEEDKKFYRFVVVLWRHEEVCWFREKGYYFGVRLVCSRRKKNGERCMW